MNITLVLIATIIILAGVFGSKNRGNISIDIKPTDTPQVKAETTEEPEPLVSSTPTPTATIVPTPSPTKTASPTSAPLTGSYSNWKYPNAGVVSEGDKLVMTSGDNPDNIMNWYKSKVEGGGYNVRNSIKTNSNGLVKDTIQGVKGNESIGIVINKKPSETLSKIEVEIGSL